MIVAESIGFAATHSISEILVTLPGYDVGHGTQHFVDKGQLGTGSQTPEDFVAAMAQAEQAGQTAIAVHTLFPPPQLKPLVEAAGGRFWLLVRNPTDQIESCYAWMLGTLLKGHSANFMTVLAKSVNELTRIGVPASLPNCAYLYAASHVLTFNLVAVGIGAPFHRMEDLLGSEAAFRAAFDLPGDLPIPHFAGEPVHRAAHRSRESIAVVADPERDLILSLFALPIGDRRYSVSDMERLLGYAT